jgi:hypothetical protein
LICVIIIPAAPRSRVARTKELVHIADLRTDEAYLDRDPA